MLVVKLWKICLKLRRIILLHFEHITFRFAHGRTLKPLISMISRFSDVSLNPTTIYFCLWRHQDTPNNPRKNKYVFFENCVLGNLRFGHLGNVGNVCPVRLKSSSFILLLKLWSLDTTLWNFDIFWTLQFWNFKTLKLWSQKFLIFK